MRANRLVWFFISILVGAGIALVYGWMINPVTYVNTTPDNLRKDYKADYVLMVAEIFQTEQNLPMATRRLELLDSDSPMRQVQRAILTAQELGYSSRDLETMGKLSAALLPGGQLPATQPAGGQPVAQPTETAPVPLATVTATGGAQ